ncbi:FAD-dependent oxidoreductase [Aggregatilineales bacterium SYSU G02658]
MDAEVLIIGAGLSGLSAGRVLQAAGKRVLLMDKGRSVGGRMATRRIQNGLADHGAQFFTARTEVFQQVVDEWLVQGRVRVWGHGWSDGSLKHTVNDGHPRYVSVGGMNALTHHLAEGLNVRLNAQALSVRYDSHRWIVRYGDEGLLTAGVLILTPPVPQSLKLLMEGSVDLHPDDRAALEHIEYGPCLCGLFVIDGDVNLPEPGAIQNLNKVVYWVADNQRKGISEQRIITLHVESSYSRAHYDDPDENTLAFLRDELKQYLAPDAAIVEEQLKKWRYSVPLTTHPFDCLTAQGLPLVFAGDAFGGQGRVEGAYMSGRAAGQAALDLLK